MTENWEYHSLYDLACFEGKRAYLSINPDLNYPGKYDANAKTIELRGDVEIQEAFPEEFIHFIGGLNDGRLNVEFEAKFIQDIVNVRNSEGTMLRGAGEMYSDDYFNYVYDMSNLLYSLTIYDILGYMGELSYFDFLEDWAASQSSYEGDAYSSVPQLLNYLCDVHY